MVAVIGAFAFVHPPALVDTTDVFAKTIQDILRFHGIGETIRLLGQIGYRFHHGQKRTHDTFGIKRLTVSLFVNHSKTPLLCFLNRHSVKRTNVFLMGNYSNSTFSCNSNSVELHIANMLFECCANFLTCDSGGFPYCGRPPPFAVSMQKEKHHTSYKVQCLFGGE